MNVDMNGGNSWRGVPLTEMYGSQSPWGAPEFPLVSPSYNHAVLYHVPSSGCVAADRPPKPQIGHDKWDSEHVRMPYSSQSLYPVNNSNGQRDLVKRWEMIENALSKPIRNSHELADAILSYNTKFKSIWKFKGLHKFFDEYIEEDESQYFFDVTLPEVAKLALALPKLVQAPIPLLKQHKNRSISLSQQQIASLLANAFFCTFPRRNSTKKTSEYAAYPFINFNTYRFYEATDSDSNMEKLKSLCHYFRRVVTKVPVGCVTFTRRSVPPRGCPDWSGSNVPLATLPLHVDSERTIEDAHSLIQVDFANKYLGGGVLGHGCVQEEIRFVICPELMVSMLFTEVLRPNEALMIIGCERYSKYTGYGHTFRWAGDYIDNTPRDSSCRRRCAVLAIDAVPYSSVLKEYTREAVTRELNKAWVGVSFDTEASESLQYPGVATGNWGCGAFGGTPHLKSLLQLMACAQARRPMSYFTFGDTQLRDDIVNMYNLLSRCNVTVGQLYNHIIKFSQEKNVAVSRLHPYLEQVLTRKKQATPPRDDVMETSMTESVPETVVMIENELLNDSPDLFSQDEMEQGLAQVAMETDDRNKQTKQSPEKSEHNNDVTHQNVDETKQNALETQQKSVETLQKSIETQQKSIETQQKSVETQKKAFETQQKAAETKQNSSNARMSLVDAMQRLDGEEERSSPLHSLLGNQRRTSFLNSSSTSMDSDKPEKKKIKKITDFFKTAT